MPFGTVGELACRSGSLMAGYDGAPSATAAVTDVDGWYYTGDLATMDEHGYVRIAGRKRDLIVRSGQNLYPAELEHFLEGHPGISRVAVVGLPDDRRGERVCAFVVPALGRRTDRGRRPRLLPWPPVPVQGPRCRPAGDRPGDDRERRGPQVPAASGAVTAVCSLVLRWCDERH